MAKALPDTVIARIVRNKAFRQQCLTALNTAGQSLAEMENQLDQLEAEGAISQSERAAIRAQDIIQLSGVAVEAALAAIDEADEINAA